MVQIHSTTPEIRKEVMITLENNLKKLEEISKLEKNWNSYGANPIQKEVIEKSKRVLKIIKECKVEQPFISPTGRETIQMEWDKNMFYLEFEIGTEKEIDVFLADESNVDKGFPLTLEGKIRLEKEYIKRLLTMFMSS